MNRLHQLYMEMIRYYQGDAARIQHFVKVHSFAKYIGEEEGLTETVQLTLEAAALVHDIGIRAAEKKYGYSNGKLQEQEGPPLALEMLENLGFDAPIIERVCYLVAHHHTYEPVNGLDYRILLEADALVNLYEDAVHEEGVKAAYEHIFKTETARNICRMMFEIEKR